MIRELQLWDTGVLQQLNRVKGVLMATPQHPVTPGRDAPLCRGVIAVCAWVKLVCWRKGQLPFLIPLQRQMKCLLTIFQKVHIKLNLEVILGLHRRKGLPAGDGCRFDVSYPSPERQQTLPVDKTIACTLLLNQPIQCFCTQKCVGTPQAMTTF